MTGSILDLLNTVASTGENFSYFVRDADGKMVKCSGPVDAMQKMVEARIGKDSDQYRELFKPWQKKFIDEL